MRLPALVLCVALCLPLCCCAPGRDDAVPKVVAVAVSDSPAPPPTLSPTPAPAPTPVPSPTPDLSMEPFTVAWFGDTQSYASTYPEQFAAMAQWVIDNRAALNIQYVVHTGDIVNQPEVQAEWDNARAALTPLCGVLPFFSAAGNHDLIGMLTQTGKDYTRYADLMEALGCATTPTLAYHDATWSRRYDLLTIGQEDFIFIGAGYGLSLADYDWLNGVLAQYADRTAVLVAHSYLGFDGKPQDEGRFLYRKVVMKNPNVKYVLCGHRHRVQHTVQEIDADFNNLSERSVYAFMNDYQGYEKGGGGYLVLLTFDPKLREIRTTSYSPVQDDYNFFEDEAIETYTLPYL